MTIVASKELSCERTMAVPRIPHWPMIRQAIYCFDPAKVRVYVAQQMTIFMEAVSNSPQLAQTSSKEKQ